MKLFRTTVDFCRTIGHMLSTTIFRVLTMACIALIMHHVNLDVVLYRFAGTEIVPFANFPLAQMCWNPQIVIPAFDVALSHVVLFAGFGYLLSGVVRLTIFLARCVWRLMKKAWAFYVQLFRDFVALCKPLWVKLVNWPRPIIDKMTLTTK